MASRKKHKRYGSFREFWPFYLSEHSKPATRWVHFAGTHLGVAVALVSLALGKPWFLLLALVCGYGPAWFAHFFIEKNRPATFKYPLWSFRGDFKMAFLLWRGLFR
jgi:hypothetical protein